MAKPFFRISMALRAPDSRDDSAAEDVYKTTRTVARSSSPMTDGDYEEGEDRVEAGYRFGGLTALELVETVAEVAAQLFQWRKTELNGFDAAHFVSHFLQNIPNGKEAWGETLRHVPEDTDWPMIPNDAP
jgi:hypothetical protein